ncbi:MAG: citrate synthase, partial [Clostridia bacterium]|nr:citrate synthase [Clostridia bacterium]
MKNQDLEMFNAPDKMRKLADLCVKKSSIPPELYVEHSVNRGLRDQNGNGVVTGLTEISEINSFKMLDGVKTPIEGELFYRGVPIADLTEGFIKEKRFGFEETAYLLLFGKLPTAKELEEFNDILVSYR